MARQPGIDDPGALATCRDMPARWRHTAGIRDRYGHRDFAAQSGRFAFTACFTAGRNGEVTSPVPLRAARRQLLTRQILLPGHNVLMRLIAAVR